MTKAERLEWIKARFEARRELMDAVKVEPARLSISAKTHDQAADEAVQGLEGFRESLRDQHAASEALTSDEI